MAESKDLLLIARDWPSRALTLAELEEAGHEVTAVPGIRWGRELLERRRIDPPIVVLDVHADPDADPDEIARLIALAPNARFILITGVFDPWDWKGVEGGVTMLRRPVAIGDIVAAVHRIR